MIQIESGTDNVYADLGIKDAEGMFVKAPLVNKIGEAIHSGKWSQSQVAEILGMTELELSKLLLGQFSDVGESKMLDCLVRLGYDVKIVVSPVHDEVSSGRKTVVFAS